MCEVKGLSKPTSKRRHSELWTSYSAANRGTDSYNTSGRRAKRQLRDSAQQVIDFTTPSSIMAAPASEDFTSPPEACDTSNVETGERRDMFTLTFQPYVALKSLARTDAVQNALQYLAHAYCAVANHVRNFCHHRTLATLATVGSFVHLFL